jgi:hypothetical protein
MSVVFPIAIGVASAITGAVRSYLNTGSFIPLAGGAVVALAASILAAMAYSARARSRAPAFRPGGAIALSVFAGVLMAGFYPILRFGAWGEHVCGLFAGMIWMAGAVANFAVVNSPSTLFAVVNSPSVSSLAPRPAINWGKALLWLQRSGDCSPGANSEARCFEPSYY